MSLLSHDRYQYDNPIHSKQRSTDQNMALTCWQPRSPDLTPCDFFLWGYIKDIAFVPPLSVSVNDLKQRMTSAVASVDKDMLWCGCSFASHFKNMFMQGYISHKYIYLILYKLCLYEISLAAHFICCKYCMMEQIKIFFLGLIS
jgi:hypothetical protein